VICQVGLFAALLDQAHHGLPASGWASGVGPLNRDEGQVVRQGLARAAGRFARAGVSIGCATTSPVRLSALLGLVGDGLPVGGAGLGLWVGWPAAR
jgi:hypothetical protein